MAFNFIWKFIYLNESVSRLEYESRIKYEKKNKNQTNFCK